MGKQIIGVYLRSTKDEDVPPVFNKSTTHKYGDNIYTQTDRVLIAEEFYYFGGDAILLPADYQPLIWRGRNHGVTCDSALIESFVNYIREQYSPGMHGLPFSRKAGKFERYGG